MLPMYHDEPHPFMHGGHISEDDLFATQLFGDKLAGKLMINLNTKWEQFSRLIFPGGVIGH